MKGLKRKNLPTLGNREEAKKKITHSDGSGKRVPTRTHTICIVVVRMYVCKGGVLYILRYIRQVYASLNDIDSHRV